MKRNKYRCWYGQLMKKAFKRRRWAVEFYQIHYVKPIQAGGTDRPINRRWLTAREAFVAVRMLTKMAETALEKEAAGSLLAYYLLASEAAWRTDAWRQARWADMQHQTEGQVSKLPPTPSSLYAAARRASALYDSSLYRDKEQGLINSQRRGELNPFYGRHHSEKVKKALSARMTGVNHPFYGKKRPEHAAQMRIVMKGKPKTALHKKHISESWHASRASLIICPHCNKTTIRSMHIRWHGDKCKQLLAITPDT